MASLSTNSHLRTLSLTDPFADPTILPEPNPEPRSAPPTQTKHSTRRTLPEKEVMTVKPVEPSPRHKMGRAATAAASPAPTPPSGNGMITPQPPKSNRSLSHDSASQNTSSDKRRPKPSSKGSIHADVIDRLDFSGIGTAMFHHDGPFDACAPSRNRHRTKAPMLAWSGSNRTPEANEPFTVTNLEESVGQIGLNDSPYPTMVMPPAPPVRMASDVVGRGRLAEEVPKKRTDALAEAWGVHEPEPYEEFLAGGGSGRGSAASSLRGGKESHTQATQVGSSPTTRRPREGKERDSNNYVEETRPAAPRRHTTRNQLPPPQPIFGSQIPQRQGKETPLSSSPPRSGADTKRSTSLMHRIRKMRETPNVPLTNHDEAENTNPSPSSSLENYTDKSDEKGLPTLPPDSPDSVGVSSGTEAYFDTGNAGGVGGIARRTSLMKKMVKGVKRAGKA